MSTTDRTSQSEGSSSPKRWPILALLACATVVYLPVLWMPFLNWDDLFMIVSNADLDPHRWPAILGYWNPAHPFIGLYIPVTYSAYFLLSCLGQLHAAKLEPGFFHAANLAAHLVAGWLVWRVLQRLGARGWPTLLGTGLFLLHPIQVEAVCWAASLNTVLAGAIATAALLVYVRASQTAPAGRARWTFAGSCALFAMALLAKPSVCGLPLATLAIDRLMLRSDWRPALRRSAAWIVVAIPVVFAGRNAQPGAAIHTALVARPIVAADALGFYLTKLAAPVGLTVDYGRTPAFVVGCPPSSACFVGIALAALVFVIRVGRSRPWVTAGALIFVAGLAPVLGILDFDFQRYSTVADRYAYPSMIGVALAAAFASRKLSTRTAAVATCAILISCTAASTMQLRFWRSDTALFTHALRFNSESFAAHGMLARIESAASNDAEDPAERQRLRASARQHFERALAVRPDDRALRLNFAALLEEADNFDDAVTQYEILAGQDLWNDARLHLRWGRALEGAGRIADAEAQLRRAVALDPTSAEALAELEALAARHRP